ncbi:hypothetical protein B0H63DRAFT_528177 [Podospora didyma]|uniref:Uncharacterized protein n=1 Tax=Podospora didyma TaxID=330526 RepID=A0AAE0K6P1_9PEZI|nr:hypothetical protein B0H63DRAFT_528177 [Podospora didyma]
MTKITNILLLLATVALSATALPAPGADGNGIAVLAVRDPQNPPNGGPVGGGGTVQGDVGPGRPATPRPPTPPPAPRPPPPPMPTRPAPAPPVPGDQGPGTPVSRPQARPPSRGGKGKKRNAVQEAADQAQSMKDNDNVLRLQTIYRLPLPIVACIRSCSGANVNSVDMMGNIAMSFRLHKSINATFGSIASQVEDFSGRVLTISMLLQLGWDPKASLDGTLLHSIGDFASYDPDFTAVALRLA